MCTDAQSVDERPADEREVLATVDGTDGRPQFVVADIATDEAWVSIPERAACALGEWR